VVNPIQMRWDSRGRLWVIQSTTYPQLAPGEEPNDKVLILEDTDRDGRADKTTVFAEGLLIPTGIEIAPVPAALQIDREDAKSASVEEGAVPSSSGSAAPSRAPSAAYIGEGTKLWLMIDRDGDGRADEKHVVLRGFGTGDNHQNINSFRWSPGGDLMFSQGLHTHSRIETRHGRVGLDHAGFFRFQPLRQRLDAFYGGHSDPQNPWGFAFTEWGQMLMVAGNNGSIFDPLPEMIRGFQNGRRPNIWENARGRKTSGPDIVGTAHLPEEWQGVFLNGGYINNAVWALKVESAGASYRLTDLPPLIQSSHTSFRPVDVKIGPDGAIYICDWYNPIIGHYQASFRHPDRDKLHGRIWRVTYKGRPLVQWPQIAGAPLPALLEHLRSPERWVREQTKRELAGREASEVLKALRSWWPQLASGDPRAEHARFEALGVFESHESVELPLLHRLVESTVPEARAYAAGVLGRWQHSLAEDPLPLITKLAGDEHPRVRLAAIVAAGNIPRPESLAAVLSVRNPDNDEQLELAARTAAKVLETHWQALIASASGELSAPWQERFAALRSDPVAKTAPKKEATVQLKDEPAAGKLRATQEFVTALSAEVLERGDAARGAAVYQRAELACIACHSIADKGGTIGPPLDSIGSGQPLDFIIGAVLEPQREIKESYEAMEVTAKDGRVVLGYLVARDAESLTIRDPATLAETRFTIAEVEKQRTTGSFMPAGLVDQLSREELRDLFRYLSELGKPKLSGN
jgi:putative heme-binding domain-containing protein